MNTSQQQAVERFQEKCCKNGLYGNDGMDYYDTEKDVLDFILSERSLAKKELMREIHKEALSCHDDIFTNDTNTGIALVVGKITSLADREGITLD